MLLAARKRGGQDGRKRNGARLTGTSVPSPSSSSFPSPNPPTVSASQPEALPAGADGQARPCPPQVGDGVQGLSRQHRQLHESPGVCARGESKGPRDGRSSLEGPRSTVLNSPFLHTLFFTPFPMQLSNTEEFQDGKSNGMLGEVFIRCNNVLYLRELKDQER